MREIKFRGLSKRYKKWIYGYYSKHPDGSESIYDGNSDDIIIPETGGQLTGLHDKNGKEIYEGDMVKCVEWWEGIVTWVNTGSVGWRIKPLNKNKYKGWYGLNSFYECEVIGNIHENQELLKD